MQTPAFDPGLTQKFTAPVSRVINKDGSFNVRRRGGNWHDINPYLHLVNMSWPAFLLTVFVGYLAVNLVFALAFFSLGPGHLAGIDASTAAGRLLDTFFFSAHTLTTVGYGNMSPKSNAANVIAVFEAMTGVMGFAVATGLLFGRVSRPSAKIGFSANMLVAPYQGGTSLQFRVVNRRRNDLMELQARVMLMTVETRDDKTLRQYKLLKLEREKVLFLPLTWTVVHPIDAESPLWGLGPEDLARLQAEVLILIKGYDDTFSQTVFSRYSYRHEEVLWNRRFAPAFDVDAEGDLMLDLEKIGQVSE